LATPERNGRDAAKTALGQEFVGPRTIRGGPVVNAYGHWKAKPQGGGDGLAAREETVSAFVDGAWLRRTDNVYGYVQIWISGGGYGHRVGGAGG